MSYYDYHRDLFLTDLSAMASAKERNGGTSNSTRGFVATGLNPLNPHLLPPKVDIFRSHTTDYYLDLLNFLPGAPERLQCSAELDSFVLNECNFDLLIRNSGHLQERAAEFLKKIGDRFWGPHNRKHLSQPSVEDGFVYGFDEAE